MSRREARQELRADIWKYAPDAGTWIAAKLAGARREEDLMSTVAMSSRRVMDQTDPAVNDRIERQIHANIIFYAHHPEKIDERLRALDSEWDIERWLQLNSAALTTFGILLGVTRNRLWLLLPLAVQSFFLQHGVQGWCPPLPMLRRFGVRTETEIEAERCALRVLRGDFQQARSAEGALETARR